MNDPYVYPHTEILKNLADVRDNDELACMEAEYTSIRLAEIVVQDSVNCFDLNALCEMHRYIFQDIYEWAGQIRTMNIEKEEPALGGISIEYSDFHNIEKDVRKVVEEMNRFLWKEKDIETVAHTFSESLANLWKIHPYREGNTRTIVTFCSQFIESQGFYINSELFKDNAQYMRTALVAANAIFSDLGDRRKPEYLERIILDALLQGQEMKEQVVAEIEKAGRKSTEETIRKIVYWNRLEHRKHTSEEIKKNLF